MPSTYSTSLRLNLQGTGDNSGTWGTIANNNVFLMLEQAVTGVLSIDVSGTGDYTLTTANGTTDQSRNMILVLTGLLTGARNIIVPSVNKMYLIFNNTTGAFALTVKTVGGTGTTIPQVARRLVYCDGVNVNDGSPIASAPGFGTAGAPSYSFSGDATSGLNGVSAGILSLAAGATEVLRATATGVGIGTTAVNSILNIGGRVQAAPVVLTASPTIAWNLALGNVFTLTLNQSCTLGNPTNMVAGTTYIVNITQDAFGARSLSFGTAYNFGSNGTPILSPTSAAVDILMFYCDGARMLGIYNQGY